MNKGWTIAGLIVLVLMLLVPPKEATVYDTYGAAADEAINLEGVPDRDVPGEHISAKVVYRPVWMEVSGELDYGEQVQDSQLAETRLLLQVVVVVVIFGGMALIIGGESAESDD